MSIFMSIYFFACSQFVLEVQTCGHSKHCLYHLRRDNVCRRLPRWLLGHTWECCSHNGDLLDRIDEVNLLVHKQKCINSRHLQTVIYTYTYIYIIYIYYIQSLSRFIIALVPELSVMRGVLEKVKKNVAGLGSFWYTLSVWLKKMHPKQFWWDC